MSTMRTLATAAAALTLAGCAGTYPSGMMGGPSAAARLEPTRGNTTAGMAMFHQRGQDVVLHVRLDGLRPGQEHGFHIHEKGDCSSGDGMSTGGHFNPNAKPHGRHDAAERHAGDLPSLKADASGRVDMHFTLNGLAIGSGATDILGRGLIVHAQPDDYTTQPTGNAGARIACGVIQKHPG